MLPELTSVAININPDHGFCLTRTSIEWMAANGYEEAKSVLSTGDDIIFACTLPRHNPWLIKAVKALGPLACENGCEIVVVEISYPIYHIFKQGKIEMAIQRSEMESVEWIDATSPTP